MQGTGPLARHVLLTRAVPFIKELSLFQELDRPI